MKKICFVVQRYGLEVNGGSELYCRLLAEKLSSNFEVHVYTTCAIDYTTWKNVYVPGVECLNKVFVHRYLVETERNMDSFCALSNWLNSNPSHNMAAELKWIHLQGPVCDALLEELQVVYRNYKAVIFMTYLYYLSAMGLPKDFPNAILIPTLHDERPAYLQHYQSVFKSAKGFIWNTRAEKKFANKHFRGIKNTPGTLAGIGIDIPSGDLPDLPDALRGMDYIVYAGRIDESKGCKLMFESFLAYRQEYHRHIKLVVIGKEVLKVPKDESIVYLGFVSEALKFTIMQAARALVLFSEYESLSMVVLESMFMGRPVLVNGKCEVLKDHCTSSNAGLYFYNYREFAESLEYLYTHDKEYHMMCQNGRNYVNRNYRWDIIIRRIVHLINQVSLDI